jgi:hypothetical protein
MYIHTAVQTCSQFHTRSSYLRMYIPTEARSIATISSSMSRLARCSPTSLGFHRRWAETLCAGRVCVLLASEAPNTSSAAEGTTEAE